MKKVTRKTALEISRKILIQAEKERSMKEYKRCPCCGGEHKCNPSKCLKEVRVKVEEAQQALLTATKDIGFARSNLISMSNYCIDNGWMKP